MSWPDRTTIVSSNSSQWAPGAVLVRFLVEEEFQESIAETVAQKARFLEDGVAVAFTGIIFAKRS